MYANMDVIFCRNVMIYFSEIARKQLVRSFYNILRPGGYLYIGHSETLHGISKAFRLVYFRNALVYQKEVTSTPAWSRAASEYPLTERIPIVPGPDSSGAIRALDLLSKIKPTAASK